MAIDGAENTVLAFSDRRVSVEQPPSRRRVLHSVEEALANAAVNAAAIDEPVLAYFIEMAVAEAKRLQRPRSAGPLSAKRR